MSIMDSPFLEEIYCNTLRSQLRIRDYQITKFDVYPNSSKVGFTIAAKQGRMTHILFANGEHISDIVTILENQYFRIVSDSQVQNFRELTDKYFIL